MHCDRALHFKDSHKNIRPGSNPGPSLSEQREVYSLGRIASRRVAKNLDFGRARSIGEHLAVAVVGHVHPECSVGTIFALGQVDRLLGCVLR